MKFSINGMENIQVQIFILMRLFCQKKRCRLKRRQDKKELNDFRASNRWLDGWKKTYGVREKRLCAEADDISTTTIEAWIERLPELYQEYEPQNILNLDKLRLFFKTLPENRLAEEKSKVKRGKNRNNK